MDEAYADAGVAKVRAGFPSHTSRAHRVSRSTVTVIVFPSRLVLDHADE
jgi:hypothetical protein